MVKKAYESSKGYILMFAIFSVVFYNASSTIVSTAVENIGKIPVILEKVSAMEGKQDECVDSASSCKHDIVVLQGYHNGH